MDALNGVVLLTHEQRVLNRLVMLDYFLTLRTIKASRQFAQFGEVERVELINNLRVAGEILAMLPGEKK